MSPEDITICPGFDESERDVIARIYWEAFGHKLGAVYGPENRAHAFLLRSLRSDHCLTARGKHGEVLGVAGFKSPKGAFVDGCPKTMRRVYGRLGALWRKSALHLLSHEVDNRRFLIDGIAVQNDAQGKGVGSRLIAALCARARADGYGAIRLEVIDSNRRARKLYERMGFVATGTERLGPLRWLFGFSEATTMIRSLEPPVQQHHPANDISQIYRLPARQA